MAVTLVLTTACKDNGKKVYPIPIPNPVTVAVTGVMLAEKALVLTPGAKRFLTATVLPANATNKSVVWNSDNNTVTTVNSATGELSVHSAGKAVITATTVDGGFADECLLTAEFSNTNIFVADPFILEDKGVYYLYGTSSANGIVVWRSTDLLRWEGPCGATQGLALHKNDSWGERNFWAPEVYNIHGQYVMTYSVESHIAVAEASSPLGPFVQDEKKPLVDENGIDSHIFMDDDGTAHLYWVRFQSGNIIYTARMSQDLKSVDMTTAQHCITPQQGTWERTQAEPRANVAEGPFVIKRDDKYYLSYSCNHYQSPDYAVGWAVADKPEGPWTRNKDNPILLRHAGYAGTGHHAFLKTSSGKVYIVYHAHNSLTAIAPRRTLISECQWDASPGFVTVEQGCSELVKND